MYYVYILRCADNSLYTGIASDYKRRFSEHISKKGAKYTKSHQALEIVALWQCCDKASAARLEYRIKKLDKAKKEAIVEVPERLTSIFGQKLDTNAYIYIKDK